MVQELIIAASLGIIGGVIPGPVITAIFTEILQKGLKGSWRIIFIAFFTESLVAVISLLLFSALGLNESFFRALSILGAGILIWIATSIWKVRSLDNGQQVHFSFWKITLMIISNGVLWTYWITICIPKAMLLGEKLHAGEYIFMILGQLGWLLSTSILATVFSSFRKVLSGPRIIPVLFKFFSLVFAYFALDMLIRSILYFIQLHS